MPTYTIQLSQSAHNSLDTLPAEAQSRLTETLESVAQERQITNHSKCHRLHGEQNAYKVREGDYRAIVTLDKPDLLVFKIGKRQGMYENVDELYAEL